MVDATYDTKYLLQMVDFTCDTHDLMVDTKETQVIDDSLTSHDTESYSVHMKESLDEDESQKDTQNDNNNNNNCEEVEEQIQRDFSKIFVRDFEELSFNKDRYGLGYDKRNNFHSPDYSKPIQFVRSIFHEEVKNITNKC